MPENDNDNKEFEFIKEQVIEKKRRKAKKLLVPILMTIFLAILFGLIAAVTFVISEPRLYKLLHKEEDIKTPISFPTEYPGDPDKSESKTPEVTPAAENDTTTKEANEEETKANPVIVEKTIEADINDFIDMYDEVRNIAYKINKSLVDISSVIDGNDLFGNPVDRTIKTTGLVIYNDDEDLYILVSLDRVKDASSINIELTDSVVVPAVLYNYESELNLAVITVPVKDIPSAYLKEIQVAHMGESYTIAVGSPILALGSPNGHNNSIELGIITSRGSSVSITDNKLDLFNTDISNNEYSDGIIVNLRGEVIGMITRTLKDDINENLCTVIGISKVKSYIERMANKSPRVYFGVLTEEMTVEAKSAHNVSNGIYVKEVQTNSPAFIAGIKNGDIILQVNDQSIVNINNFYNTVTSFRPEDEIKVKVKRTSGSTEKEMDFTITLAEKAK